MLQQYLEAGRIVTTHGVRGEMKLEVWCDGPQQLRGVKTLWRGPGTGPLRVRSLRAAGQAALLCLEGVDDLDAARALRGTVLYFDRAEAPLPAGRWFRADLIGCEVVDAHTGVCYGVVTDLQHPGPQDIYTVRTPAGSEYLLPGVPAFIHTQDPEHGRILVTPIPGLLDGDAAVEPPEPGAEEENEDGNAH